MKHSAFILVPLMLAALVLWVINAPPSMATPTGIFRDFDDTTRFIFYSVLEGCYEDGLSNQDVDQILMKNDHQRYYHFIYSCPVCTPAVWAFETYRQRPERFYSLKSSASTFGAGLPGPLEKQLFSQDPHQRLIAINSMMKDWIELHMDNEHLNATQRRSLQEALEEKRKQGMACLKEYRTLENQGSQNGLSTYAPAYIHLNECAVCDGAVGKLMPLPEDNAKPADK